LQNKSVHFILTYLRNIDITVNISSISYRCRNDIDELCDIDSDIDIS